jgi:hypothetical protein
MRAAAFVQNVTGELRLRDDHGRQVSGARPSVCAACAAFVDTARGGTFVQIARWRLGSYGSAAPRNFLVDRLRELRHSGINCFIFELVCVRGSMSLRAFLRLNLSSFDRPSFVYQDVGGVPVKTAS